MVPLVPRLNNLDWLRLGFALQVMLVHAATHLGLWVPSIIQHFPGVPAFFFISGMLVYTSYLSDPQRYARNRFLRLFPGLLAVTVGSLAILLLARGWRDFADNFPTYALWFMAQITLGQAYHPEIFRQVGVGVINGSLWSITTEILFYMAVPAIAALERKIRHIVLVLTVLSYAVYVIGPGLLDQLVYRDKTLFDVLALTPVPWGWMFGLGMLAARHFEDLKPWIRYFPVAILPMALMIMFGDSLLLATAGTSLSLAYFLAFAALVLWAGFETPPRAIPDISYGIYLWHMPVINLLIVIGLASGGLAVALTLAAAAVSYRFVEKPVLALKQRPAPA